MTYDNIKSHKNSTVHPLSRRYIFGKTTGGFKLRVLGLTMRLFKLFEL